MHEFSLNISGCSNKASRMTRKDQVMMQQNLSTKSNLILSDELASCKRTSSLENFTKKLLGDIYMNISYIAEITKLSD